MRPPSSVHTMFTALARVSNLQFDGICGILWSQGEIPGKYGITKGAVTMRFQYTEKKVTLPENVHKYAEKKVMKLERFFGTDADALVTFSVEKNRNNVEITVHAANTYFRASESTSDMFASIDAAVATIERQIRKNKTRLARRLRQDAFVRTPDETSFAPDEPEEGTFELVRTKKFNMKPMTREEAILQMNLLEHTFFAFRDEDNDGAFAVVYKRTDGGYGLIEDEA